MGICELIKKISPSFSTAYDSAIFTFPSLTDFISDPFSTIPASKISLKKKLKDAFRFIVMISVSYTHLRAHET